jgi:ABC-type transport system involved in multi-copper enzyme maturation permease subunit
MALTHLTDFSDKLSPMLVKELRQGMRARSFTMLFLVFQGLLAVIMLTAGASFEFEGAGTVASSIIFTMFSIAVLFIQPMRGVNALSSEITGNTIEMMVLTRLSAWRIVFGKWIAIVSQSALILTTIIPYLILRYFFGGMVLIGELVFLGLIFLTSMALTAVMVGFSATTVRIARVLPIFGVIILAQIVPSYLYRGRFGSGMGYFSLSDWDSIIGIGCYLVFIAYVGWCALSHGTSAIAPAAENHSTIRRLIALGLTLVAVGIGVFQELDPRPLASILAIILVPALLTALTESPVILPPICKPFLKRGMPGRIAAAFLLPGWPTGAFYTALVAAISLVGIGYAMFINTINPEVAIVCLSFLGSVLLPALLAALFTKEESKRFTNFMIFLVASICVAVAAMIFTGINSNEPALWLLIWNPPVVLFMMGTSKFDNHTLLMAIALVDSAIFLALLGTALKAYGEYQRVFVEAKESLVTKIASVTASPSGS